MIVKCITSKYGNFTNGKIYDYVVRFTNAKTNNISVITIQDDDFCSYNIDLNNYNKKMFDIVLEI